MVQHDSFLLRGLLGIIQRLKFLFHSILDPSYNYSQQILNIFILIPTNHFKAEMNASYHFEISGIFYYFSLNPLNSADSIAPSI